MLQLDGCGVTPAGLAAIAPGLPNLRHLDADVHGDVTAAIPVLARLPLQRLQLGHFCTFSTESLAVFLPSWRSLLR